MAFTFYFVIFKHVHVLAFFRISCEIALMWMKQDLIDAQPTFKWSWHWLNAVEQQAITPWNNVKQDPWRVAGPPRFISNVCPKK